MRELKASGGGVPKERIAAEVKILLDLKQQLGISPAPGKSSAGKGGSKAKKNKK